MAKKDHLTEELNRHFGFGTFKGNQKAIIENVLAGKDTFVLMPTGGFDEESGGRDAEFQ